MIKFFRTHTDDHLDKMAELVHTSIPTLNKIVIDGHESLSDKELQDFHDTVLFVFEDVMCLAAERRGLTSCEKKTRRFNPFKK